jgi:uncharacterized protein YeaO (DUF488 family)
MIRLKRVYEPPATSDGLRVLVDRYWPRGLAQSDAALDLWMKDIAPTPALRIWFDHRPDRWAEFRRRYGAELRQASPAGRLRLLATGTDLTLLYAARDPLHNHARVIAEHLRRPPARNPP